MTELPQSASEDDQLLTTPELADMFRVSPRTIRTWHVRGKLPGSWRTPGGKVRMRLSDVNKVIEDAR